jgi:hypothetical protein
MNRDWVLQNLREAAEELRDTIAEIEADPDYDSDVLRVPLSHLFHHLNTAWHSRDVDDARIAVGSKEDFEHWRRFPKDFDM